MQDVLSFLLDSAEKVLTATDPKKSKNIIIEEEKEVVEATAKILNEGYGNIFIQWDDKAKNYIVIYGKKVRFA